MPGMALRCSAAVALRDDLILEVFRGVLSTEERLERAAQPCPLLPQAIANAFQLGARVVGDLARRIDLVADLRSFASKRRRAGACRLEQRKRAGRASNRPARLVDRVEKVCEGDQTKRLERTSFNRQRSQNLRQLARRTQGEQGVGRQIPRRLGRRRQQLSDLLRVGRRCETPEALGPHRRKRGRTHRLDDPIEFEGPQGS